MSDRITQENISTRLENLNARMESRGSSIRYNANMDSGAMNLYRCWDSGAQIGLVTRGTKSEIGHTLSMMMNVLDDARRVK